MTVSSYTTNFHFGLVDFNSNTWHIQEWDNWKLLDALMQQEFGNLPFVVAGGTADVMTLTYVPAYISYASGMYIAFQTPATANTGAVTVNVNGLGAKSLKAGGSALAAGDLQANTIVRAIYNGTDFAVLEPFVRLSRLTISSGNSGVTIDADADELKIEGAGNTGLSILTPNTATGAVYFGDPEDSDVSGIEYNHSTNKMSFLSGGRYRFDGTTTKGLEFDLSGATDFVLKETTTANVVQLGAGATGGVFVDVSNGRVGIGTGLTAPTHALDVDVDAHFAASVVIVGAVTLTAALTLNGGLSTPLALAQGGTGASSAANARTNLGLGALATLGTVNNDNWNGVDLSIANGGTGASDAATALTNLGAAPLASPNFTGTPQYGSIEIGYRDIPRVTGGKVRGKCEAVTAGFTLDTGEAAGNTFSFYNDSASSVTITQGGGLTLRQAGTASTGNRTLAARGLATVWCNSTTEYIITGNIS